MDIVEMLDFIYSHNVLLDNSLDNLLFSFSF